jgi:hypothetical protein
VFGGEGNGYELGFVAHLRHKDEAEGSCEGCQTKQQHDVSSFVLI